MAQYANIAVIWAVRSIAANLIILPFLSKYLRDTSLIFLAITTTILGMILTTIGHDFLYVVLVGMLFAFYWPIEKISNSLLSKLIGQNEVGTAFSLLAVLAKCIEFLAKPAFGLLYRNTVGIFPATFLMVSTGFLIFIFILMMIVHLWPAQKSEIPTPNQA